MSLKDEQSYLRRMIGEQLKLRQEKATLEKMLLNIQTLRSKLKVEQMQLSSLLRAELGQDFGPSGESPSSSNNNAGVEDSYDPENELSAKEPPKLDLAVDTLDKMFSGRFYKVEEQEEEEEIEEYDDESDSSVEQVEGAMEMNDYGSNLDFN